MNDTRIDKLDALILLAKDSVLDTDMKEIKARDTSDIAVDPSFQRKILKFIRKVRIKQKEITQSRLVGALRKTAVACLIICTVLFISAMSIEAVRNEFISTIMSWYEKYIAVTFTEIPDTSPETIEVKREPTDVPAQLKKVITTDFLLEYSINYEMNGKLILQYSQNLLTENESWLNNKNGIIKKIALQSGEALLIEYEHDNIKEYSLIWNDREYSYILSSFGNMLSKDDILVIAETVK